MPLTLWMHACHMHVQFIVSCRSLMDTHFPDMETVAGLNLNFDSTRVYTAVARSFTTLTAHTACCLSEIIKHFVVFYISHYRDRDIFASKIFCL